MYCLFRAVDARSGVGQYTHGEHAHTRNLSIFSDTLSLLDQVWDILMGKILNAITAHSKTITSLCRDASLPISSACSTEA